MVYCDISEPRPNPLRILGGSQKGTFAPSARRPHPPVPLLGKNEGKSEFALQFKIDFEQPSPWEADGAGDKFYTERVAGYELLP